MTKRPDKKLTYEQALASLEQLIEDIESGDAGLEQTLESYEKGVKLISHCRSILERVEKRMTELKVQDQAMESDDTDEVFEADAEFEDGWNAEDDQRGPNAHG